ncbi:hypothetical protein [Streptomyces malaysiense]|uniref:Uncharacterized protein n=1 Tax=Streptomyces malaysiense TaxID=1428626 RepID=A0A1J4Q1W7_9ACTN|nr:hypothetical protein [Streptomyces malaysiense]OIK27002.1 hypothetical protein VT52_013545 [Streptomyces malaysiense]
MIELEGTPSWSVDVTKKKASFQLLGLKVDDALQVAGQCIDVDQTSQSNRQLPATDDPSRTLPA